MNKLDSECLSPLKLFERLVQLETIVKVSATKDTEALVLAREIAEKDILIERQRLDHRFELAVTKISIVEKLTYVGFGLAVAASFVVPWLMMKAHTP